MGVRMLSRISFDISIVVPVAESSQSNDQKFPPPMMTKSNEFASAAKSASNLRIPHDR